MKDDRHISTRLKALKPFVGFIRLSPFQGFTFMPIMFQRAFPDAIDVRSSTLSVITHKKML
jgi:hypothetical protein